MAYMFDGCTKLTSLDMSNFVISWTVTNMEQMFANCSSVETLDLSHFLTENVTNMRAMFAGCSKLKSLDLFKFETQNVKEMQQMFQDCSSLTNVNLSSFNTDKLENMAFMFKNCSALTKLDLSNFDTQHVSRMTNLFFGCANLDTIYVDGDKFKVPSLCSSMFFGCTNLKGDRTCSVDAAASDKPDDWAGKLYARTDDGYLSDKKNIKPWVIYDADKKLLTFQNSAKSHFYDNEYQLNKGTENPGWITDHKSDITQVKFDKSFAGARPTTCYGWFKECLNLNSIEGLENLNTENVTSMANMFANCYALTSLDLSSFDTHKVTDMSDMFHMSYDEGSQSPSKLSTIYITYGKFVTDSATGDNMFTGCDALGGDVKYADKLKSEGTVANGLRYAMSYFSDKNEKKAYAKYDESTKTLTFLYDKDKQDSTYGENEYPLNKGHILPAWCKLSIDKVVFDPSFANAYPRTCHYWFAGDGSVRTKPLSEIDGIQYLNTDYVTDMGYMFAYCNNLVSLDVSHFNTQNVTDMGYMFYGCSKLTSLDLSNFNTQNVTKMNNMFVGCKGLTSLNLSNFNTVNVTTMHRMFFLCENLPSLNISNFNTANVTNMREMFSTCSKLTSLDLSNFNTTKVTDMDYMFYDCGNLTSLDVSHFNTQNVTTMKLMFNYCKNLQKIYASDKFSTSAAETDGALFADCTELQGAVKYDAAKVDKDMANYKTGYFTKLVAKLGNEKIGAVGETLTAGHDMTLSDDKDLTLYDTDGFKAASASYTRTNVKGGQWASLCLPFKISTKDAQFRAYTLLSATDDVITLQEETADIAAGTPLLIQVKEGATALNIEGVANSEDGDKSIDIKAVKEGSATADVAYQLVGLYTTKMFDKGTDNNCYIVKGDKLMNPAKMLEASEAVQKVGSRPYRAYVQASKPTAQANMLSIAINDEATGIKVIDTLNGDTPAEYYDMQGRRINGLQKGINIVKRGNKTTKVIIR